MLITMLSLTKIHRATVTHCEVDYNGSMGIDRDADRSARHDRHGQQIDVLNINNGTRFTTYINRRTRRLQAHSAFTARRRIWSKPGDRVIIIAYAQMEPANEAKSYKPTVLILVYADKSIDCESDIDPCQYRTRHSKPECELSRQPDFLLELFSEEIPARMQADAAGAFAEIACWKNYKKEGRDHPVSAALKGFVTPRRLAVWIKNIPVSQQAAVPKPNSKARRSGAPEAGAARVPQKSGLTPKRSVRARRRLFRDRGEQRRQAHGRCAENIDLKIFYPASRGPNPCAGAAMRRHGCARCIRFCASLTARSFPSRSRGITASNTTRGHRFLAPATITVSQSRRNMKQHCLKSTCDRRPRSAEGRDFSAS